MVVLTTIATRTGDEGTTALADGIRRSKSCPLVGLVGEVDELNSHLGLAVLAGRDNKLLTLILSQVQNDLFDLGADLSTRISP